MSEYDEDGKRKKPRQKQEKIGRAGLGGYTAKAKSSLAKRAPAAEINFSRPPSVGIEFSKVVEIRKILAIENAWRRSG